MKIHLDASTSLGDFQKRFSDLFPGKKLEFFFQGTEGLNLSGMLHKSFQGTRISELCPRCTFGDMELPENMTIIQFEQTIRQNLGLPVKVYLKKDGYWLRSGSYDHLPLANSIPV